MLSSLLKKTQEIQGLQKREIFNLKPVYSTIWRYCKSLPPTRIWKRFLGSLCSSCLLVHCKFNAPIIHHWYVDDKGNKTQQSNPKYGDNDNQIQLKFNVYGCKQAARNRFKDLMQGLLVERFWQSKVNSCMFLQHRDCIMVIYTNDYLISLRMTKILVTQY